MAKDSSIFDFDNSFAREMDGFYANIEAEKAPSPSMILFNAELAESLGLNANALNSDEGLEILAGNQIPEGAHPLAQAYAGHQFGGFSPSLGDGRALLLGEVIDQSGHRQDIQLKGSGRTPFSRNGDGKAALGPVLREYLFSEAMHALGIPTTRSLAAVTTGSDVFRERPLPGAVLTRVAASHIRVGTFQFFAARGQTEKVRQLADYAINRHDPDLADKEDKYILFLDRVISRQSKLVARWMAVGFIHGVMNTDNMTLSGQTIDYGPCAFLDTYHPDTVFSSIDDHGRYAYARQPLMLQWNLARLAESLLELIAPGDSDKAVEIATKRIEAVSTQYEQDWLDLLVEKIGLSRSSENDALATTLLDVMKNGKADFTLTFRMLSHAVRENDKRLLGLFETPDEILQWLEKWRSHLDSDGGQEAIERMQKANPIYIPRNHLVENVLAKAVDEGDLGPFEIFMRVLARPFEQADGMEEFELGAPASHRPHITYCGT